MELCPQTANYTGYNFDTIRDVFGPLISANTPDTAANDAIKYRQSVDLTALYKDRVVSLFGAFVTAAMMNARNSFLSNIISPLWETSEMNFTVNRQEFNQIEFNEVATAGIGREQTHYRYGWTDTVTKWKKEARITEELALDPNFGMEWYLAELATFASTALKTIDLNTIYSVINIGWQNETWTRDQQMMGTFDVQKAWNAEARYFHIMAKNPDEGFDMVRNLGDVIDGLDTVIVQDKTWTYVRNIKGGEPMQIFGQRMRTDIEMQRVDAEIFAAGDSLKTFVLGNQRINFHELKGFRVNSTDRYVEHPLETQVTLCHFFDMDEDIDYRTPVQSTNPNMLDIEVYCQTKDSGRLRTLTMEERLRSCFLWDEKDGGKPSIYVLRYAEELTRRVQNDKDLVPHSWNERNGRMAMSIDEEDLSFNYVKPDPMDVTGKSLDDMEFRRDFFGVTYLPDEHRFEVPQRVGDYHLNAITNENIHRAAKYYVLKAKIENDVSNLDNIYFETWDLLNEMQAAAVTGDFLEDLIVANSTDGRPNLEYTPEARLEQFPEAHRILEWKGNRFGALNLPSGGNNRNYGGDVPPGYHFGGGLQELASKANDASSPFQKAGKRAERVIRYWMSKATALNENIGENDLTNEKLTELWIHTDSVLNGLIASFIGRPQPTFLATPGQMNVREVDLFQRYADVENDARIPDVIDNLDDDEKLNTYVSNMARLVSVLTVPARQRLMDFYAYISARNWTARVRPLLDVAAKFLLDQVAKYNAGNVTANNARAVSVILVDILDKATAAAGNDTSERGLIALISSLKKSTAFYFSDGGDLEARRAAIVQLKNTYAEIWEGNTGFSADLQQYELNNRVQENEDGASEAFHRAPFMWSEQVDAYVRAHPNDALLRAADPLTFYETPLSGPLEMDDRKYVRDVFNLGTGLHSLAKRHIIHSRLAANLSSRTGSKGQRSMQVEEPLNLFSPLSSKSKSRVNREPAAKTMSSLLNMGASVFDSAPDPRRGGNVRRGVNYTVGADGDIMVDYTRALKHEYFGPWKTRLAYANSIKSPAERFYFLALIQAYNNLSTFVNVARLGCTLIGVIVFRPFVQFNCFSMIAMRAGSETLVSAIGHSIVKVSKEHRGIYHMSCEFHHGIVRLNPQNIALLPYAFPSSFVGGKKVDFMVDPSHFYLQNPEKESCIAMPEPLGEWHATPFHILNKEMEKQEDADNAVAYRKFSSAGFYEWVFGEQTVRTVDAYQAQRHTHTTITPASHVAHRCALIRMDPKCPTLKRVQCDASGPGCSLRENCGDAYLAAMGRGRYPERAELNVYEHQAC